MFHPNSRVRARVLWNDEPQFDVIYEIDSSQRRFTPADNAKHRQNFLLYFGCSFTFGEGVEQNETLPYFTALLARDFSVYNYGVNGGSPSDALGLVTRRPFGSDVSEGRGIAIFAFIPEHLSRMLGGSDVGWAEEHLYYELDKAGEPQLIGDVKTARPIQTLIYHWVGSSRVLQRIGVALPLWRPVKDYRLAARVLGATRSALQSWRPLDGFYVIFWPVAGYKNKAISRYMMDALRVEGISYIDLTDVYDAQDRRNRVSEHNGHPSARAHRLVAQAVVRELGLEHPGFAR
jgi:hypothetical protein